MSEAQSGMCRFHIGRPVRERPFRLLPRHVERAGSRASEAAAHRVDLARQCRQRLRVQQPRRPLLLALNFGHLPALLDHRPPTFRAGVNEVCLPELSGAARQYGDRAGAERTDPGPRCRRAGCAVRAARLAGVCGVTREEPFGDAGLVIGCVSRSSVARTLAERASNAHRLSH